METAHGDGVATGPAGPGRDVIDIQWYADGEAFTGAYVADRKRMREFEDAPPEFTLWTDS